MNTLELKPGDKIGVFFYDDRRGTKAKIEEIEQVSPTGVVTLTSGTRYNQQGKEVGALGDPTYLCTIEKAQMLIDKAWESKQQKLTEYNEYLASPEGKRANAASEALKALIQTLNQHGWWSDEDGHMDVLESEIKLLLDRYLSEHNPV
jgi:hypothetical protein